jgi:hypothetical protein
MTAMALVLLTSVSADAASDAKPQQQTTTTTTRSTTTSDAKGFTCGTKTKCSEMTSCDEAKYYYSTCGLKKLDGDKDGTPCESLCNPKKK